MLLINRNSLKKIYNNLSLKFGKHCQK